MFPLQIKSKLIDIISKHFTNEEIDLIGKNLFGKFNAHFLSGQPFGTILQTSVAAKTLVEYCFQQNKIKELTELIISMGLHSGKAIVLRDLEIPEIHELLTLLSSLGFHFKNNTLVFTEEKDRWGYLEENKEYYFSYMSIDIVGNSKIQMVYSKDLVEEIYSKLQKLIKIIVEFYDGKIWSWAGDGGLAAFYINQVEEVAVFSAIKILNELSIFNLDPTRNKFNEPIKLRIGIHAGLSVYKQQKGNILSDAINFVAHLEKNYTNANHISISNTIYEKLNPRLQKAFQEKGIFEDKQCYHLNLDFPFVS